MRRSLRSWIWRVPIDQEVDEELSFHIDMRTRDLVARGMDSNTARAVALRQMGDVASLKRTCIDLGRKREREMRLKQWLEELRDDVKFAARQLRGSPAFTVVAALTLALGIGANSAIFALVDAALLRPLPYAQPERLFILWERSDTLLRGRASPPNMIDWADRSRTFEKMAAFFGGLGGMVMSGADGTAETVARQWVTADLFDVLGVKAIVGRTFLPSDNARRANVVVLSEPFWRTRFGGDPKVVGTDIRFDGLQFTVVGVVPKEFQLLGRPAIWAMVPISHVPAARGAHVLEVVGRLKPGVSLEAATSDMRGVADTLSQEYPDNKGRSVLIEPMRDVLIGQELQLTSMIFLGVVGFVLLICCANVANLLLARGTARSRELAVRSALGAGRKRIVRQLLTESLVLAVVGGVLGAVIGSVILSIAPALIPEGLLPATVTLQFDLHVVLFCGGAALFVGLLFGLAPAWQATEFSAARALASESRSATARGGRTRRFLVASEVATAVLLLVGAGLLLRTLIAVDRVDRGYRAESVLTMMVDPLGSSYPTAQALQQFFDAVEQETRAVAGVRDVGWTSTLPLLPSDGGGVSFEIVGDPRVETGRRPTADQQIVSPTYFQTVDLPLVAGRGFTTQDRRDTVPVCIVSEAFVRRHLQGRSPIGVRLALRPGPRPEAQPAVKEIIGVARQVKARPDEVEDPVQIYVPIAQNLVDDIYMVVRPTDGRAKTLTAPVRAAIGRIDNEQLVSVRDIKTLDDIQWDATGRHRLRAVMVTTFAGLALLLAMVGLFGILAYSVQQRVREFGVRMAVGATMRDVLRLVVSNAMRIIAAGAVVGLVLAAILGRLLTTVLFGVQPLDVMTFVLVTIVLAITAILSTAGPAWRASRIDPAVALRTE